jgi:hypothetical protein
MRQSVTVIISLAAVGDLQGVGNLCATLDLQATWRSIAASARIFWIDVDRNLLEGHDAV